MSVHSAPAFSRPQQARDFVKNVDKFMASNPEWGKKLAELDFKNPVIAQKKLEELYQGVGTVEVVYKEAEISIGAKFLEIWHIINVTTPAKENVFKAFAKSVTENSSFTPAEAHDFISIWTKRNKIRAELGDDVTLVEALEYLKNEKQTMFISWVADTQATNPVLKEYDEKKKLQKAARLVKKEEREARAKAHFESTVQKMSLPEDIKTVLLGLYLKKMDNDEIVGLAVKLTAFLDALRVKTDETIADEFARMAQEIVRGDQPLAQRMINSPAVNPFVKEKVEVAFDAEWKPEHSPTSAHTEPIPGNRASQASRKPTQRIRESTQTNDDSGSGSESDGPSRTPRTPEPQDDFIIEDDDGDDVPITTVNDGAVNTVPPQTEEQVATAESVHSGASRGSRRSARLAAKQSDGNGPTITIHPAPDTSVFTLDRAGYDEMIQDECYTAPECLIDMEWRRLNGVWQIRSMNVPVGKKRKGHFGDATPEQIDGIKEVLRWLRSS